MVDRDLELIFDGFDQRGRPAGLERPIDPAGTATACDLDPEVPRQGQEGDPARPLVDVGDDDHVAEPLALPADLDRIVVVERGRRVGADEQDVHDPLPRFQIARHGGQAAAEGHSIDGCSPPVAVVQQ